MIQFFIRQKAKKHFYMLFFNLQEKKIDGEKSHSEEYSEPNLTSKMMHFMKKANGFQSYFRLFLPKAPS